MKHWLWNSIACICIIIACTLLGAIAGLGVGLSIIHAIASDSGKAVCGAAGGVFTMLPVGAGAILGIISGILTSILYLIREARSGNSGPEPLSHRSVNSQTAAHFRRERSYKVYVIALIGFGLNLALFIFIWKQF